mmetsp:Transcript_51791/g.113584  ORF Transcript_51791/g.113584 Transcript_51791/m.113584 type:complete len:231 (-) Transcript_51791:1420-2112(-)
MVIIVHWKSLRSTSCASRSDSSSREAVASSRSNTPPFTLCRRTSTRARQSNCCSPTEKLEPPSSIWACKPPAAATRPERCTLSSAAVSTSSGAVLKGSILNRNVPLNMVAVCGTIETTFRKSCRPMSSTLTPSMERRPPAGSTKRIMVLSKVDLPQPVRPMMPTRLPPCTVNDNLLSTKGNSGRYLTLISSNSTVPLDGQPLCGRLSSTTSGASVGMSHTYWLILSTLTI